MGRAMFAVLALLILGCATPKPEVPVTDYEPDVGNPAFENGMAALERQDYVSAAEIFDRLLIAKPATERDLVILYNSAAAYQGLGNCPKAAERYREVVRSSAKKFQEIEAQALFRLSFMYECLGDNRKAITSLLDARKRAKYLPYEVAHAEVPARLAAGYSRIGNRKKALEYFKLASAGLKQIVTKESGRRQQEVLGNTLFLMGQLNPAQRRAEGDPLAFLQSLSMQQPYLLQAIELNHPVWSKQAAEDLNQAYANFWKYQVDGAEKKNAFYTRALQTARELKRLRLPDGGAVVEEVFAMVGRTESRLQNELAKVAESNRLTKEAEKREGLKREGRLVTPGKKSPVKKR